MTDARDPARVGHLPLPAVVASVPASVAAGAMRRRGVDALVVLDHGMVCGLLTERDLLRAVTVDRPAESYVSVGDVCSRQLAQVMTPDPLVVDADAPVAWAARAMLDAGVGAAVTVGDRGVTGVITGRDVATTVDQSANLEEVPVSEVTFEVLPVALADGLEHAIAAVRRADGRPVPVVHDDQLVGTVALHAAAAFAATPAAPVTASSAVHRHRGAPRLYDRGRRLDREPQG